MDGSNPRLSSLVDSPPPLLLGLLAVLALRIHRPSDYGSCCCCCCCCCCCSLLTTAGTSSQCTVRAWFRLRSPRHCASVPLLFTSLCLSIPPLSTFVTGPLACCGCCCCCCCCTAIHHSVVSAAMTPRVTLFTRPGCTLCDSVKFVIRKVSQKVANPQHPPSQTNHLPHLSPIS